MPSQHMCSETAAMFKQLLLKPLSMPSTRDPPDVQLVEAFAPFCSPGGGATAYGRAWLTFASPQPSRAQRPRDGGSWIEIRGRRFGKPKKCKKSSFGCAPSTWSA